MNISSRRIRGGGFRVGGVRGILVVGEVGEEDLE